jgi:hypothetical protein
MPCVKAVLLSLSAVALLSSCTTLANRRDLYAPKKPDGPYTKTYGWGFLRGEDWNRTVSKRTTQTRTTQWQAPPMPALPPAPVPQPPPLPGGDAEIPAPPLE